MISNSNANDSTLWTGWDLRGLSSDNKPTDSQLPNGSTFIEMDTGKVYMWDKENTQWRLI